VAPARGRVDTPASPDTSSREGRPGVEVCASACCLLLSLLVPSSASSPAPQVAHSHARPKRSERDAPRPCHHTAALNWLQQRPRRRRSLRRSPIPIPAQRRCLRNRGGAHATCGTYRRPGEGTTAMPAGAATPVRRGVRRASLRAGSGVGHPQSGHPGGVYTLSHLPLLCSSGLTGWSASSTTF
jgi:hypothetical protein